jgi:hypothetical protein
LVHNTPKRTPPHKQTPEQEQTHTTHHTTTPGHPGEDNKTSRRQLRRRHQRCATAKPQPAASPNGPPELLHHGTDPLKPYTRKLNSQIQRNSSRTLHLGTRNTTDPGHTAWGPRLTPLPRTQISEAAMGASSPPYSPRTQQNLAQRLKISNTHGPSAFSRQHEASASGSTSGHTSTGTGLQIRRLQEGHDARRRHRTSKEGQGLHPESPERQ